jgi:hypothetical protein
MSSCHEFLSEIRKLLGDDGSIESFDEKPYMFRFQLVYKGRLEYFDVTPEFISDVDATVAAEHIFDLMLAKHGGMRR